MKYTVVIEKTPTGFSAYAPDLPGMGTTGANLDEIRHEIREAVEFHIEGLKNAGLPFPNQQVLP